MLNKVFKMGTKMVNAAICIVGLSFLAGTVAGAVIAGYGKDVHFSVGGETVLGDKKDEEKTTEEDEA